MLCFAVLPLRADQMKCPAPVTHLSTPNGQYSPQSGVTFVLQDFVADMVARGRKSPLCFARITDIRKGEVFVSAESLSHEFESKIRQSPDSKIHDFKVETKQNVIDLSGKIKKLVLVPFTLEGPVTTDGHSLIFQAKTIKAGGIPVKGLLDMLGKHLSSLMQSESVNGVTVKGDTLIFEPEQIAHVRGYIVWAEVTPRGLLVKFAGTPVKQAKK
ncbi:MAG: hypothetical protein ACXVZV_06580 [Terriglobales bacterium]